MSETDLQPCLNAPPTRSRRLVINLIVAVFLLVQLAIPISYYVVAEPTSERFAWRMFSSIDVSSWDSQMTSIVDADGSKVERPVPLATVFQESYVKSVEQAQLDIIEPIMRRLSSEPGVSEIRFEARRTAPSGKVHDPIKYSMKPGGLFQTQAD